MNKKLASLILRITANGAEAEKVLRDFEKSVDKFGKKMTKFGKEFSKNFTAPLVALGGVAVKVANTQLQAEAKLLNALKGREDVQRRLMESAAELQSRSTIGDEVIIDQQAYLAALGLTEQQIRQTIEAAVQLSYATGVELEGAVKNLAKTYSGLTGELGESIPALKELTAEELKSGEAIAYVNENYKGFAETAATTGAGSLVQLKNQLGDLAEMIGTVLLPVIRNLTEWVSGVVKTLQGLPPGLIKAGTAVGAFVAGIGPLLMIGGKISGLFKGLIGLIPKFAKGLKWGVATPVGFAVSAFTTLAGAIANLTINIKSSEAELDKLKKANLNSRKEEAYNLAMKMYNKPSVSDEEISRLIGEYQAQLDKDASYWQSANGGGLTRQQREALSVQRETIRALNEILSIRKREREEEEALLEVERKKTAEIKAKEILKAKMRVEALKSENANPITSAVADLVSLTSVSGPKMGSLRGLGIAKLRRMFEEGEKEVKAIAEISDRINSILLNSFTDLVTTIGEGIGALISGEEFNPLQSFLDLLGRTLKQLGSALISYGTAMIAAKKSLATVFATPWVTVAAGIITTAAGAALTAIAKKPIKLATGGLAYGPTLAVVGDNVGASRDPEVIAPLSKLREYVGGSRIEIGGEIEWKLRGDHLRAVLSRENFKVVRLGYEL